MPSWRQRRRGTDPDEQILEVGRFFLFRGPADLSFNDEHPFPAATLRHRSHARIAATARRWARAEQPGRRPGALRLGRGLDGVPAVLDRRSRPQWPLRLGRRLDGVPAGSNGSRRQLQPRGNHAYDRLHVVSEWRLRLQSACSSYTPPDPCSRGTARPRPRGAPSSLTRMHRFGSGGRWALAARRSRAALAETVRPGSATTASYAAVTSVRIPDRLALAGVLASRNPLT